MFFPQLTSLVYMCVYVCVCVCVCMRANVCAPMRASVCVCLCVTALDRAVMVGARLHFFSLFRYYQCSKILQNAMTWVLVLKLTLWRFSLLYYRNICSSRITSPMHFCCSLLCLMMIEQVHLWWPLWCQPFGWRAIDFVILDDQAWKPKPLGVFFVCATWTCRSWSMNDKAIRCNMHKSMHDHEHQRESALALDSAVHEWKLHISDLLRARRRHDVTSTVTCYYARRQGGFVWILRAKWPDRGWCSDVLPACRLYTLQTLEHGTFPYIDCPRLWGKTWLRQLGKTWLWREIEESAIASAASQEQLHTVQFVKKTEKDKRLTLMSCWAELEAVERWGFGERVRWRACAVWRMRCFSPLSSELTSSLEVIRWWTVLLHHSFKYFQIGPISRWRQ